MSRARSVIDEALARPRHVVLSAVVAGLLAAPLASRGVALGLAMALLAAGAAAGRPGLALAAAAGLLVGAATGDARLAAGERPTVAPLLGGPLTGQVVVLDAVRKRSFGGWS